jgi:hypothetical protein
VAGLGARNFKRGFLWDRNNKKNERTYEKTETSSVRKRKGDRKK